MVGYLTEQAVQIQGEHALATAQPPVHTIVVDLTPDQAQSLLGTWKPEERHRPAQVVFRIDGRAVGMLQVVASLFHPDGP